jgi:two-component system nitrate/nitrite response regulator NarL
MPSNLLSLRERQVVELVAEGLDNKSIGVALKISALTVKTHLARITQRLNANNRAHIVAECFRLGLIS